MFATLQSGLTMWRQEYVHVGLANFMPSRSITSTERNMISLKAHQTSSRRSMISLKRPNLKGLRLQIRPTTSYLNGLRHYLKGLWLRLTIAWLCIKEPITLAEMKGVWLHLKGLSFAFVSTGRCRWARDFVLWSCGSCYDPTVSKGCRITFAR